MCAFRYIVLSDSHLKIKEICLFVGFREQLWWHVYIRDVNETRTFETKTETETTTLETETETKILKTGLETTAILKLLWYEKVTQSMINWQSHSLKA